MVYIQEVRSLCKISRRKGHLDVPEVGRFCQDLHCENGLQITGISGVPVEKRLRFRVVSHLVCDAQVLPGSDAKNRGERAGGTAVGRRSVRKLDCCTWHVRPGGQNWHPFGAAQHPAVVGFGFCKVLLVPVSKTFHLGRHAPLCDRRNLFSTPARPYCIGKPCKQFGGGQKSVLVVVERCVTYRFEGIEHTS